ncbi:MAG: hypothetical protein C0407_17660, partial [Desulfobacca sp.]|nr:hypothetical protein [Desulfobacca sp.]
MLTIYSSISLLLNRVPKPFIRPIPWVLFLIRLALGLIFVVAGATKLQDPQAFARIISRYDLLPDFLLPVTAIGLPILELLAGIGVILAV